MTRKVVIVSFIALSSLLIVFIARTPGKEYYSHAKSASHETQSNNERGRAISTGKASSNLEKSSYSDIDCDDIQSQGFVSSLLQSWQGRNFFSYFEREPIWLKFKQGAGGVLIVDYPAYEAYSTDAITALAKGGDLRASAIIAINELNAQSSTAPFGSEGHITDRLRKIKAVEDVALRGETGLLIYLSEAYHLLSEQLYASNREELTDIAGDLSATGSAWLMIATTRGSFSERVLAKSRLTTGGLIFRHEHLQDVMHRKQLEIEAAFQFQPKQIDDEELAAESEAIDWKIDEFHNLQKLDYCKNNQRKK